MEKKLLKDGYILETNPIVPFDVDCPRNTNLLLNETVCKSYTNSKDRVIVCNDGTIIIWGKRTPSKSRMYQDIVSHFGNKSNGSN